MAFSLRKIHEFQRRPGSQVEVLTRISPALRLSAQGQEIYIQDGRYWTPGGDPILSKNLPEWVAGELKKCSPKALAECGINIKVEQKEA